MLHYLICCTNDFSFGHGSSFGLIVLVLDISLSFHFFSISLLFVTIRFSVPAPESDISPRNLVLFSGELY